MVQVWGYDPVSLVTCACQPTDHTYLKLMVKGKPQGLAADLGVRVSVREGSIVKLPRPSQPGMSASKSRLFASEVFWVSLSVRRQPVRLAVCGGQRRILCGIDHDAVRYGPCTPAPLRVRFRLLAAGSSR